MRRRALATILLLGCSESEPAAPARDAGSTGCPAGTTATGDGACMPAGLPEDMPCPPGEWQRDDGSCVVAGVPPEGCATGFLHDGDRRCDPVLPRSCAPSTMAIPGDSECREIAPCGTDTWDGIAIDASTEHVDADYAGADADGSAAKPWPTITQAVEAADDGAVVAIAAGTYAESVWISSKRVVLWGRCPAMVEIVGTATDPAAILVGTGAASGTEIKNLAVTGAAHGVYVSGARGVVADRVWIHDLGGRGISIEDSDGSTALTISASLVEANREMGVFAAGSSLTIEGSVIRLTEPVAGKEGFGVQLEGGSVATIAGSVIEDNRGAGIVVLGSDASLEGSVVRRTRAAGASAAGIYADAGPAGARSNVGVLGSLLDDNGDIGLFAQASDVSVESTTIRAHGAGSAAPISGGVFLRSSLDELERATGHVTTSLVENHEGVGVAIGSSDLTMERSAVRGVGAGASDPRARGISVQGSPTTGARASATIDSCLVADVQDTGVSVVEADAIVVQSAIRQTWNSGASTPAGVVVGAPGAVGAPATADIRATLVEDGDGVGLAFAGATGIVASSVVRNVRGRGMQVQPPCDELSCDANRPSNVTLRALLVDQSVEVGVMVFSSSAALEDCVVSNTAALPDGTLGDGLAVVAEGAAASAHVSHSLLENNSRAGIAAFGAAVGLGASVLSCNAFDLAAEPSAGAPAAFEDLGANTCGCPEGSEACLARSAQIAPPAPSKL